MTPIRWKEQTINIAECAPVGNASAAEMFDARTRVLLIRTQTSPSEETLFDARFSLESPTGALLNVHRAAARGAERGVLVIFHGLAEHAARYGRLAAETGERGFHVYAPDHRGHGSTTAFDAPLRRFAAAKGAIKVVADGRAVLERAAREHPGLPIVVLGQAMGAHVALGLALHAAPGLAGLALWNADVTFTYRERLAASALKTERALKGSDVASAVFARAAFGAWSRSIASRRTDADWLSHDRRSVDAYIADPFCGWTPTVSMALDLLDLLRAASGGTAWSRLPSALPVHLLGGREDPATRNGRTVETLAGSLRHAGSRDVQLDLIDGARHDVLHEIESIRAEAMLRFVAWLDRVAPTSTGLS